VRLSSNVRCVYRQTSWASIVKRQVRLSSNVMASRINRKIMTGHRRKIVTGHRRKIVTGHRRKIVTGHRRKVVTGHRRKIVTGHRRKALRLYGQTSGALTCVKTERTQIIYRRT